MITEMKTKIIVHIGTEKTGTTSIQEFLKNNRNILAKNGIYIPLSLMDSSSNHRWLPLIANNQDFKDEFVKKKNLEDPVLRQTKLSEIKDNFSNEIKKNVTLCPTFIVSSEQLHSRLNRLEEIERLQEYLSNLFDEVKILIYLRHQLSTAVSRLSTGLKFGGILKELYSPNEKIISNICNHGDSLQKWEKVFGISNLEIRLFEKKDLKNGDVISDFCNTCFKSISLNSFKKLKFRNQTLSLTGMQMMYFINKRFKDLVDKKVHNYRGNVSEFIAENTNDGSIFLPSKEQYYEYENFYASSNKYVKEKFFPKRKILFSPSIHFSSHSIDLSDFRISNELAVDLVSKLWIKLYNK